MFNSWCDPKARSVDSAEPSTGRAPALEAELEQHWQNIVRGCKCKPCRGYYLPKTSSVALTTWRHDRTIKEFDMSNPTCSISECPKLKYSRGYCRPHYRRLMKYGDPLYVPPLNRDAKCAFDKCDENVFSKQLCRFHYQRCRDGIDEPPAESTFALEITDCAIEDCHSPARSKGWCIMHYQRWKATGDPVKKKPTALPPRFSGENHPMWSGDNVGYHGVHKRLAATRGKASDYPCTDCGNKAAHWSYEYTDANAIDSPLGPFSRTPEHYSPRCAPCHRIFDNKYSGTTERVG